jgi:hypothetical protein
MTTVFTVTASESEISHIDADILISIWLQTASYNHAVAFTASWPSGESVLGA